MKKFSCLFLFTFVQPFAVTRNFVWMTNGVLPLQEISLGQATALSAVQEISFGRASALSAVREIPFGRASALSAV